MRKSIEIAFLKKCSSPRPQRRGGGGYDLQMDPLSSLEARIRFMMVHNVLFCSCQMSTFRSSEAMKWSTIVFFYEKMKQNSRKVWSREDKRECLNWICKTTRGSEQLRVCQRKLHFQWNDKRVKQPMTLPRPQHDYPRGKLGFAKRTKSKAGVDGPGWNGKRGRRFGSTFESCPWVTSEI